MKMKKGGLLEGGERLLLWVVLFALWKEAAEGQI